MSLRKNNKHIEKKQHFHSHEDDSMHNFNSWSQSSDVGNIRMARPPCKNDNTIDATPARAVCGHKQMRTVEHGRA